MAEHRLGVDPSIAVTPAHLAEARERAADEAAQERAGAVAARTGVISPGWVHAVHPEHGQPVTFVAGEMLPDWVVEAWDRAVHDVERNVWTIPARGRRR